MNIKGEENTEMTVTRSRRNGCDHDQLLYIIVI